MTRDEILSAARECLGTPFAHQGRVVGRGMDCAGVICHVADRLGVQYVTPENYPRAPYQNMLREVLDGQASLYKVRPTQIGDILLMRFKTDPQHLAIMSDVGLIHAYEAAGKCCEHRLDPAWLSRIICAYRFRGTE